MRTNALPSVLVHMRTISLRTPGGPAGWSRTRTAGMIMSIEKGVAELVAGCGKGGRAWREEVSRKT